MAHNAWKSSGTTIAVYAITIHVNNRARKQKAA
jgi:hypothetical protein